MIVWLSRHSSRLVAAVVAEWLFRKVGKIIWRKECSWILDV